MIDRLVCAEGGNPDPSSTHGKKAAEAKAIELAGWDYPRHLAGRAFSVVVHGDSAGIEGLRRSLTDWLQDMGLIAAGKASVSLANQVALSRKGVPTADDGLPDPRPK